MQRMMQRLYTKQKEKGGIIDLEAEGKKFLVVTNSGNDEDEEEKFTELSPTDYQLDEQGFPCAKTSPPKSPEKTVDLSPEEETNFGPEYFRNQEHYDIGSSSWSGYIGSCSEGFFLDFFVIIVR